MNAPGAQLDPHEISSLLARAAAVGGTETIAAAGTREVLRRLRPRSETRLRVFDRVGNLIGDSATFGGWRAASGRPSGGGRSGPRPGASRRISDTGTVISE